MKDARKFLHHCFDAAVTAASPDHCLPPALDAALKRPPTGKTIVIGAGKAAASMSRTLERYWQTRFPKLPLQGCVITRYRHGADTQWIDVIEAGHPLPDNQSSQASTRLLAELATLSHDDMVICLLSGGASALLSAPAAGITIDQKRTINQQLLRSGASIHEINVVRKHLSAIKGGKLAAYCQPAQLITFMISDVPGDAPSVIGSGPTVPDPSTCIDALDIINRYALELPPDIRQQLEQGKLETPKPGDAIFNRSQQHLTANSQNALDAAADAARAKGITPIILGELEGEAREVAKVHAGIARQIKHHQQPAATPCLLLSGGETTVTVRGNGRGGRNLEFLLALGIALNGEPGIHALAADTDGIDGTEDSAGAWLDPETLQHAQTLGLNPAALLNDNNAYAFFSTLNALLITQPTRTNVNDFRALLIL